MYKQDHYKTVALYTLHNN